MKRTYWTYYGYDVWPADLNGSGIRWYAYARRGGCLKADTKESMRQLIRKDARR